MFRLETTESFSEIEQQVLNTMVEAGFDREEVKRAIKSYREGRDPYSEVEVWVTRYMLQYSL